MSRSDKNLSEKRKLYKYVKTGKCVYCVIFMGGFESKPKFVT